MSKKRKAREWWISIPTPRRWDNTLLPIAYTTKEGAMMRGGGRHKKQEIVHVKEVKESREK